MFDRYVTSQEHRAKLEYDRAYRKTRPFELISRDAIKADPKTRREWDAAWAAVAKAEQKLKWWQSRAVD